MASAALSNSFNVTEFVVNQGNGVKGLADLGIEAVPQQYIQPLHERFDSSITNPQHSTIPIIDFSNSDDPQVKEAICEAAANWGFFQIVNHGIPIDILHGLKASVHRFFDLPVPEKRKYLKDSPSESVRLATSFSPRAEQVLEWKDYLMMLYVSEDEASASWPPECRHEAIEYMKRAEIVIKRLLQVLLDKLNVKEIDKENEHMLMGAMRLNFNYYPKCPNPELTAGVGRHSDISTITVLLQDDSGGLFVHREGDITDSWIHVPPVNGALVINVGDVLQIMSNDLYKSVEHRAVPNRNTSRISIPIFVNPEPQALIGPLPQVLESGERPIYKQVKYSDYFSHFFSKPHDGKKAIEFAKLHV
ncbi:hypothetical protein CsatB_028621 [Cannabis sativa]